MRTLQKTEPNSHAAAMVDYRPALADLSASGRWSSFVTLAPAVGIITVCCALPLAWMILAIVANPQVRAEWSLNAFRMELLGRTLGYNAAAGVIAALMGLPAGYVLGRGRGLFARVLWVVIPAALLLPSLSYAYGWSQFVRILRVNEFHTPGIEWLHLKEMYFSMPFEVKVRPNGPADIFRCIWSLASWLWAAPACLIGLALRRLDTSVQQQALLDGVLRRVTFRQLLGPLAAAVAIVTVLATQEFAVYEPTGISVVATEVRMVFDTGAYSSPDNSISGPVDSGAGMRSPDQAARAAAAVVTALPLLIVTVILAGLATWGATRVSTNDALAAGDWPPVLDVSKATVIVTCLLLGVNIAVPVISLMASLRHSFSIIRMWREFGPQLNGALIVAFEAALIATLAALSAGGKWTRGLLAVALASFLVGGQLLAIAMIRLLNRPGLIWAYDTSVAAVMAYIGRFGWLAIAAGRGVWTRPWQELRDVASVDGASTFQTALHVVWPLAWPMLAAGGLMVGALSLTEVPATVLLMPQNPQVLTPTLMTWVHMARYDAMIDASLLMMGAVLVPAVSAVVLTSIGLRAARRGSRRDKSESR